MHMSHNVVEKTHPPEKGAEMGPVMDLPVERAVRIGMLLSATPGTRNVVNA